MTVLFPEDPSFQGMLKPQRMECEIRDVEYSGSIPPELDGAFYRCGPDPQFPPLLGNDILINGDGMVTLFRFQNGHVDFRSRYVRTEKFKRERAARRALFGAYRNPFTDDPSVAGVDRTTANTALIWYDHRLLAAKEDGLPFELDPETLDTGAQFDFGGKLKSPTFTAHPKFDPETGEMAFYGFECAGLGTPDTAYCVGDAQGKLVTEQWFTPPYGAMIHDFALTQNHVIFPIMPTTADVERMKAGGSHWAWDPSKPTYIGIMPRDGSVADMRYFEGPPRWSFHTMNAFDDGDKVHLDTTAAVLNAFAPGLDGVYPHPSEGPFFLTRWTCDLSANDATFTETRLYDLPSDFYAVDPRYATKPYRHGFMVAKDAKRFTPLTMGCFNLVGHIDHDTGAVATWFVGEGSAAQEPVFVPRGGDASEGDGFLLVVINRLAENRADLVILDALRLDQGPIAIVHLPIMLRMAFHGAFIPASALQRAAQIRATRQTKD